MLNLRELTEGEQLVLKCKQVTGFDLLSEYGKSIDFLQINNVSSSGIEQIKNLYIKVIDFSKSIEQIIIEFNDGMDKLLQEGKISQEDYDNFYKDTKIRLFNAFINYYNSIEQKAKKQKEYYQNLLNNLTNQ